MIPHPASQLRARAHTPKGGQTWHVLMSPPDRRIKRMICEGGLSFVTAAALPRSEANGGARCEQEPLKAG